MGIGPARGQAAVEMVGIVVAVALALAATAVWLQGAMAPPDRPPDVIGHASRPLGFPDSIRYWALPAVPYGEEGADEPIGDALRGLGRGARSAGRGWLAGRREFSGAYNRRLRERLLEIVREPLIVLAPPDFGDLSPAAVARRALGASDDARDYVARLRALPRDQLTRTILRDAGTFLADATVEVLQGLARRRLARAGRQPAPVPRRVPPHEPGP